MLMWEKCAAPVGRWGVFKGFVNENPEVIKKWKDMMPSLKSFKFSLEGLICCREEHNTHIQKDNKKKWEKSYTNHEKIYGYKCQLDLGWGQGAC